MSEKALNKRFFKGTGVVLAEHNNRLPPVADKRRVLWRRGQRKFALQAIIFFGHRKSRERSQKSLIFASGIPVQDRVVFRHDQLKVAYFYAFAHFFKAIGQLCYKLHFNIEVYRQIGVLVRRVYRPADEEVNIGRFLKKQAADK